MTFEFDNNNFATAGADEGMDTGAFNMPTKISSVTAVTDKAAAKAAKQAAKVTSDAAKQAEKAAKALARAEVKEAKEAAQTAAKAAKAADRAQAKADKEAAKVAVKAAKEHAARTAFAAAAGLLQVGDMLAAQTKSYDEFDTKNTEAKNSKLYKLLADIQAFAENVKAQPNLDDIIKGMRHKLVNEFDIKTQANSPALNIIVRYVTRTNRKNACVYARVLKVAEARNIKSTELEGFIISKNGIQNVHPDLTVKQEQVKVERANKKKLYDSWSRYAISMLANKAYSGDVLGEIKLTEQKNNDRLDGRTRSEFVHLFGYMHEGKLSVVDFAPGVTVEQEFEMLFNYGSFQLHRMRSKLGEDKAFDVFNDKIKHLFEMYNAYLESLGDHRRLTRFGETKNPEHHTIGFNVKLDVLEAVYAQQQTEKAQLAK